MLRAHEIQTVVNGCGFPVKGGITYTKITIRTIRRTRRGSTSRSEIFHL